MLTPHMSQPAQRERGSEHDHYGAGSQRAGSSAETFACQQGMGTWSADASFCG
jgi:hypothetical protein